MSMSHTLYSHVSSTACECIYMCIFMCTMEYTATMRIDMLNRACVYNPLSMHVCMHTCTHQNVMAPSNLKCVLQAKGSFHKRTSSQPKTCSAYSRNSTATPCLSSVIFVYTRSTHPGKYFFINFAFRSAPTSYRSMLPYKDRLIILRFPLSLSQLA
jgi:hypothetical protein